MLCFVTIYVCEVIYLAVLLNIYVMMVLDLHVGVKFTCLNICELKSDSDFC